MGLMASVFQPSTLRMLPRSNRDSYWKPQRERASALAAQLPSETRIVATDLNDPIAEDAKIEFIDPASLENHAGAQATWFGTPDTILPEDGPQHFLLARITYDKGPPGALLIGDAAWHMDDVRLVRGKDAPWITEERAAVMDQLRWLNGLSRAEPRLVIVASHDEEERLQLIKDGRLGARFE